MIKSSYLIIILFFVVLQSCGTHKSQLEGMAFERYSSLEGTGFTPERFEALTSHLENDLETTGMLILKDGKVIYEYGDIEDVGYIASCRKSVLSILYGKYVENGTIDLNQTIGEIGIDEDDGLLDIEKTATIDHIINARSGVFHQPANGGYDKANIKERGSVKPGEYFVYNNWDFNVAGFILEEKSGKSVYQEMEEQLAIPLGFQDWNIMNQKKRVKESKSRYPAYHMYISARDMAKIGQLMLNKGKWKGKQIISKAWIEKITSTVTPYEVLNERSGKTEASPFQFSYGYMWWLVENFKQHPDFEGAYLAQGWGGQFITVIPKLNVVVTHKYEVPTLVNWGLRPGGVSNYSYWSLLHDYVVSQKD